MCTESALITAKEVSLVDAGFIGEKKRIRYFETLCTCHGGTVVWSVVIVPVCLLGVLKMNTWPEQGKQLPD